MTELQMTFCDGQISELQTICCDGQPSHDWHAISCEGQAICCEAQIVINDGAGHSVSCEARGAMPGAPGA
jgi:hypothetical protein